MQPKSSGLVLGRRPLGAILHSSDELGELSQCLCHDDSTINIVVVIIIIIIVSVLKFFVFIWYWTGLIIVLDLFLVFFCFNFFVPCDELTGYTSAFYCTLNTQYCIVCYKHFQTTTVRPQCAPCRPQEL